MTIEEMRVEMNKPGFSVMGCCIATGLHLNSVYKIRKGATPNPGMVTFLAIKEYIEQSQNEAGVVEG